MSASNYQLAKQQIMDILAERWAFYGTKVGESARSDSADLILKLLNDRAVAIINQFAVCRDHDQPTHCVQCNLRHKAITAIWEGG